MPGEKSSSWNAPGESEIHLQRIPRPRFRHIQSTGSFFTYGSCFVPHCRHLLGVLTRDRRSYY